MNIFISYRRDDTAHLAGRLYDALVKHFGKHQVFKDVDSIPEGADFREHLTTAVSRADVVIVLLGDHWLNASDINGCRRLDTESDFVRIEIEAALSRGIPVIPLLSGKCAMPLAAELPLSIQPLAFRQAMSLRVDPDFRSDLDRLVQRLDKRRGNSTNLVQTTLTERLVGLIKSWKAVALTMVASVTVILVLWNAFYRDGAAKQQEADTPPVVGQKNPETPNEETPPQDIGQFGRNGWYEVELEVVTFRTETLTRTINVVEEGVSTPREEQYQVTVARQEVRLYTSKKYPSVEPFQKDETTYYRVTLGDENQTTILTVTKPPNNIRFRSNDKDGAPAPAVEAPEMAAPTAEDAPLPPA